MSNLKPLITFYKKVDLRSRKAMVNFLKYHFRYDTMSSWNGSTSYANRVKVWNVLPSQLHDAFFKAQECWEFRNEISAPLDVFSQTYDHQWQAGFNGRSGGYIVLYQGEKHYHTIFEFKDPHNNRDYADGYGWLTKEEAIKRGLYQARRAKTSTFPGRSTDQDEDFEDWTLGMLKERVALVQAFDQMCDDIVLTTISVLEENEVITNEIMVPKTVTVLKPKE